MKELKLFHVLSHAKWIFLAWTVFLIVQAVLAPGSYALHNTGLAVFLAGLFLGFDGFSDIEKLSKRDIKNFANPKSVKISVILLLIVAGYTLLMGIYMMNITRFKPGIKENFAIELKTVGYHCLALVFGFLCYLKLVFDKYKYYKSVYHEKNQAGPVQE